MKKLFSKIWEAVKRFFGWPVRFYREYLENAEKIEQWKRETLKRQRWPEKVKLIHEIYERAKKIYDMPGFNWQEKNNWLAVDGGGWAAVSRQLKVNGFVLEYEKDECPERNAFNFYNALQNKVFAVTPPTKAAGGNK